MDYLKNVEKKIADLETSEEFSAMASRNEFITLKDFTDSNVKDIMEKPLMNYRMLAELNKLLKANGILALLKES